MKKKHSHVTKIRLERLILDVFEHSSGFCMDNPEERAALADATTVDIMGRFDLTAKPKKTPTSVLARIL